MTYTIHDFLNIRASAGAGFSPDASKLLVMSNLSGTMQLYRAPRTGGELTQLTSFEEPIGGGTYMPTTDEIVFVRDEGGNERHQVYLMRDDGSDVRAITSDPDHIHRVGGATRDGRTIAITSNRRNGTDFDVYVHDLASGEERLVFDMGGWCEASGFSPDGNLLAVSRLGDRANDDDVYLVDVRTGDLKHICPHEEEAVVGTPSWFPDSSEFVFSTDIDRDLVGPARYDLRTDRWERLFEVDADTSCSVDWTGTHALTAANEGGYTHVTLYDASSMRKVRDVALPGRGVSSARFSHDGRFIALSFTSSIEAGDPWVYDIAADAVVRVAESPNPVPRDVFVEPESHRFTSFDGEEIPVFLYRPREANGDAPVIVMIHGGPEGQFVPSFNPLVQYMVYRGYAVVAPNVRGSTGYGKRYVHLDDKRKRLDSVRDLESLHGWLRDTPGLDHTRAALMGGSYGGYMVLAGLAFQPDLWAAGVDIVGISSLVTFLENTASWRRRFREREYGSLDEDRDFLIEASPITYVDRMKAPLFIIHGANDPRVPLGEAEQIHAVLQAKGVPTELLVYPDEGHGLAKLKNRLDAYPKALDFLDSVLMR